jgi:hypothetical protein
MNSGAAGHADKFLSILDLGRAISPGCLTKMTLKAERCPDQAPTAKGTKAPRCDVFEKPSLRTDRHLKSRCASLWSRLNACALADGGRER